MKNLDELDRTNQRRFCKGQLYLCNLLEFFMCVNRTMDKGEPVNTIYEDIQKIMQVPHKSDVACLKAQISSTQKQWAQILHCSQSASLAAMEIKAAVGPSSTTGISSIIELYISRGWGIVERGFTMPRLPHYAGGGRAVNTGEDGYADGESHNTRGRSSWFKSLCAA